MRILHLLILLLAALALPVRAEIAGKADPAFVAAIDAWLAGDEASAIPALARLAADGNSAARIHLGLIDSTPAYQGDWLTALPRADRIALLRAPGGISGRNWLREAAPTEPLARVWLQIWDGDATVDVLREFTVLGELRAAHMGARLLFMRQMRGFGTLAEDPSFPPSLLPLAIYDWQASDPTRAARGLGDLDPGDPGSSLVRGGMPSPRALLIWAQHHPLAQNLLGALGQICPGDTVSAEDFAAYLGQSGGYWALAWAGPPAQSLIDPAIYAQSPKAAETALNLLRAGALSDAETLAASPCVQGLLNK